MEWKLAALIQVEPWSDYFCWQLLIIKPELPAGHGGQIDG